MEDHDKNIIMVDDPDNFNKYRELDNRKILLILKKMAYNTNTSI